MKVTTKDVEYIAQLSRLTIPEGEMEKIHGTVQSDPQLCRYFAEA